MVSEKVKTAPSLMIVEIMVILKIVYFYELLKIKIKWIYSAR